MDGVAIALQAPEEAEGEDADGEADERHHDPNASDDGEKQLMDSVSDLGEVKDSKMMKYDFEWGKKKKGFSYEVCGEGIKQYYFLPNHM